jgi:hypothetical protein
LDILIEPTESTAQAVIDTANATGLGTYNITTADLLKPNLQCPIKKYHFLDVLTPAQGEDFDRIWNDATDTKVSLKPDPIPVRVASVKTLLDRLALSNERKHAQDRQFLRQTMG